MFWGPETQGREHKIRVIRVGSESLPGAGMSVGGLVELNLGCRG